MKKIPTVFLRDASNRKFVTEAVNPLCRWVLEGEGVATRKYDGTCCLIKGNSLFKRREVKKGKIASGNFIEVDFDSMTGKRFGWVPVEDVPEDRYFLEAFNAKPSLVWADGTYELCGPKVQGNPEGFEEHVLIAHSSAIQYSVVDRSSQGLKKFLEDRTIEGLVFHHSDGRMAKIKKKDFQY